ncbi:MAG: YggS family pyridoxal phosphate-dependent enzyme [Candidatus Omnitrophota bacterium]
MICENFAGLKNRVAKACKQIGRNPQEITIVAVAKTATIEMIKEVLDCGVIDIGENRVQDAKFKYNKLQTTNYKLQTIKWHMVGHLQTNKVKDAVAIFHLIHSVDSLRLAEKIDKEASRIKKKQAILLEVNTSGETSKFGLKPEDVIETVKQITNLNNISLKGLMTVAPIVDNQEKARPYFRRLRELKDEVNKLQTILRQAQDPERSRGTNYKLQILSMGMTDDFEVAIEEGSNMIRIGRAIFGQV